MITDHSILILVVDIYNKQNNGISCLYISGTWCNTIYRFFVCVCKENIFTSAEGYAPTVWQHVH